MRLEVRLKPRSAIIPSFNGSRELRYLERSLLHCRVTGHNKIACTIAALIIGSFPVIGETVILASSRAGWIEFLDPDTLQVRGRLYSGALTDSVAASADGKVLFVTRPHSSEPDGCCALYAFDLERGESQELFWPSLRPVVAPKASKIFAQRGNAGIEVFDSKTLVKLPTIETPSIYQFRPCPMDTGSSV